MEAQNQSKETTFVISDLCCAAEEATIRKKLGSQQGVHELQFNVISHKLTVCHSCSEEAILKSLRDAGLPGYIETGRQSTALRKTPRKQLYSTLSSGLLLLVGGLLTFLDAPYGVTAALFLASAISGGWQIAIKGFKSLKTLTLDMNLLMTIATIGAVALGDFAEGAAVIFLFALSLLLESFSVDRSRRAIQSLIRISPAKATVHRGNQEIEIPVSDVHVGDVVLIRPGERVPLDGTVISGASAVDQSPITGESMPVTKLHGDEVFTGSFNRNGSLEVSVTKPASDSTLARIIHLVENAQSKRAPSQTFIDRFASYYTPAVFGLAVAVALLPPLLFAQPFDQWFYRALVLLVIACPCALVISTPVTIVSALTNAARHGILFKGGRHLEQLANVKAIAFDKTGTLTQGRPVVTDIINLNTLSPREILRITAAAELHSEHHLADALTRKAEEEGIPLREIQTEGFESITGKGIRAVVEGRTFVVGNHQLVEDLGICSPEVESKISELENQGKTAVILTDESLVLGIIAIADQVRTESAGLVKDLHELGVKRVVLLTGDNRGTAESISGQLSVDELQAELLPEQKLSSIKSLQLRYGSVAMVGDGVNDAPALAAANVGIAMGGIGSDTALETADVVLMSDNLSKLPHGIRLGKNALSTIKQNIAIALVTKFIFLTLGIFGLTSLWLAILADDGATLVVVLNALRLLRMQDRSISSIW